MSFSAFSSSHHLEAWPDSPTCQMGQPSDLLQQRQQTDDLPSLYSDGHGVERELQFCDLGCRQVQAVG